MAKATYDIELTQGDTFSLPITLTDNATPAVAINLTSTTITSDIKQNVKSTGALVSFTVTKTNASAGQFTLSLTAAQTAALAVTKEDGSNILYYDCEFEYSPTNTQTEFGGTITVLQQVTI